MWIRDHLFPFIRFFSYLSKYKLIKNTYKDHAHSQFELSQKTFKSHKNIHIPKLK